MEIKKRLIRTMLCAMALAATAQAQIHKTIVLRDGWTFSKNGGTFNAVTLPHDWAISGKFDKNNDVWRSESIVDGKKVINESTGNTGALPWTGKGEYRTKFTETHRVWRTTDDSFTAKIHYNRCGDRYDQ